MGGRLYRSDYYGKADTWDDRTNEMTGETAESHLQYACRACCPLPTCYILEDASWQQRLCCKSSSAGLPDALDEDDKKHAYVGVVDVHFLKEHPGHMLFQGPGHIHWISEDYGKTYNAVDTPGGTLGYGRCARRLGMHARPAKPRSCCSTTQSIDFAGRSVVQAEQA